MLFAWIGFLKDGAEPIPQEVNQQTSDFLKQPYVPIHFAGPLCDEDRRAGMLLIFEAGDRSAAEALVESSPYLRAGLYDRHQLYEYRNEAGLRGSPPPEGGALQPHASPPGWSG